tara:strand:+ start:2211 stop:3830 length:1620 start_codon:yes stop_codon:yes gene_type:complete
MRLFFFIFLFTLLPLKKDPFLLLTNKNDVLRHSYIRLNLNNIPTKSNLIIKKINLAELDIKYKPTTESILISNINDSKMEEINEETETVFNEKNKFEKQELLNNSKKKQFKKVFDNIIKINDVPKKNLTNNEINILETIGKALAYNPKIKMQSNALEASKEDLKQIYSSIYPSIDLSLSKGYIKEDSSSSISSTNDERSPQDFSINLEQDLYTGGKLSAELVKAKKKLILEEEKLRLARYDVILQAALAYLDVLQYKKLIELNDLKENKFTNDLKSVELLVNVGSASQSDLVFAQSKLVETSAQKVASLNLYNSSKINFKEVIGDILPDAVLLEPNLNNIVFPKNIEEAMNIALKKNPDLKIIDLKEQIAVADIKSNYSQVMPNVKLDAEYQISDNISSKGSSSDKAEIKATLNMPIFKGGKNFSKIKQAKIIAKQVRYELESKKNEVTQSIGKSWSDFKTNETLLKSANINIEARKLILDGTEQEYKIGLKSFIDVLQSKENLIDAEYNRITVTKNYIISALKLKADIGELSLKDLYI